MPNILDLNGFANGAVAEQFNAELRRVLDNIADPNTDPKKKRKISLTLTLQANDKRDLADVDIQAKSTLAPVKPIETKLLMDMDSNGRTIAAELMSGIKDQTYFNENGEVLDHDGQPVLDNVIDYTKRGAK